MFIGTNVTALTPTIEVSANAAISPALGEVQNLIDPVTYTVTAQDGTPQGWTVTCIVDPPITTGSISGTGTDDGGSSIEGATISHRRRRRLHHTRCAGRNGLYRHRQQGWL